MAKLTRPKQYSKRWWIGIWATGWWAFTGLYIVLVVWDTMVSDAQHPNKLIALAAIILAVWVVGALLWLDTLKKAKISYKVALKDLFLTIRR